MTTLLVAPDFYSHYRPVGVLGRSLSAAGERVIVASGPAMRPYVEADGLAWVEHTDRPVVRVEVGCDEQGGHVVSAATGTAV